MSKRAEIKEAADVVKTKTRSKTALDSKSKKMEAEKRKAALAFAGELTPDKAVQKMMLAKMESSKFFDQMEKVITDQVTSYEQICEALEAKKEELQSLSDKDIINTSVEILITEAEEKEKALSEAYENKKNALIKQDEEFKATVENSKRSLAKDYDSFKENIEFEKKKLQKEYEQKKVEFETEFKNNSEDKMRVFALEMQDKQREIERYEAEHADMKEVYENFDIKVKEAVEKAVAETKNSLQTSNSFALRAKEMEYLSELNKKESEVKILQAEVNTLKDMNTSLKASNDKLNEQVSNLAREALSVSSGQAALNALKEGRSKDRSNK